MAIPYKRASVFDGGLPELRRTPQSPRDKRIAGFLCLCSPAAFRADALQACISTFSATSLLYSLPLPTPPLQPQPKHEIIPLYAGPQRPANA
jgi:hypothetical protein